MDVLESVAPLVDPDDRRIEKGLQMVLEKQNNQGRWPCEKYPKGGNWFERYVEIDEIGAPSKWVTLHAYKMLKSLFHSSVEGCR